ncbi:unnamed protein product [Moneuplotes crassus]|uniref:Uncharacterized protein n=1 Tax=Euplotes crassus TaxID=5936 RepID=A0AAD1XY78_EUPCR|nr:unnamed protein product [Moneuplotes crassus]
MTICPEFLAIRLEKFAIKSKSLFIDQSIQTSLFAAFVRVSSLNPSLQLGFSPWHR